MNAIGTLFVALAAGFPFALGGDPRIALVLLYEASHPTQVEGLWLDEQRKVGSRGSVLHLSPLGAKQEAVGFAPRRAAPGGASGTLQRSGVEPGEPGRTVPRHVRAVWRYAAIEPDDEAARQALPDSAIEWRQASATVDLHSALGAERLEALRREPDRHRLELRLLFDRDRLRLDSRVRRRPRARRGGSWALRPFSPRPRPRRSTRRR